MPTELRSILGSKDAVFNPIITTLTNVILNYIEGFYKDTGIFLDLPMIILEVKENKDYKLHCIKRLRNEYIRYARKGSYGRVLQDAADILGVDVSILLSLNKPTFIPNLIDCKMVIEAIMMLIAMNRDYDLNEHYNSFKQRLNISKDYQKDLMS